MDVNSYESPRQQNDEAKLPPEKRRTYFGVTEMDIIVVSVLLLILLVTILIPQSIWGALQST